MGYKMKATNEQTKQTYKETEKQTHRSRQQNGVSQRGMGSGEDKEVKGVKYMVTERDCASGGEHAAGYLHVVLWSDTPGIYIMLLTNVNSINLIQIWKINKAVQSIR